MVDYRKRLIDVELGWPGSVADGRVWSCSSLKKNYKAWLQQMPSSLWVTGVDQNGDEVYEDVPPFILADSAYAKTRHMVTTYKTTEMLVDPVIRDLNRKLSGARYHVENAFGILKARFQIFKEALGCTHEDVRLSIVLTASIFVLHNFLIDVNDDFDYEADIVTESQGGEGNNDDENVTPGEEEEEEMATRNILYRHMRHINEN
jgi:hypothetical protein